MRTDFKVMILSNLILATVLFYLTFDLITLLFDNTSRYALTSAELSPTHDSLLNDGEASDKPDLIPRIIHQTYKTEDVPEHWKDGQRRCIELHPDYQYILWTDKMSRAFVEKHFPWFLDTFDGYQYPIQRADAIRYFVLSHFGGIYIDLDDGCERRLDPLLKSPGFVRKTSPTGISNDVMGSVPGHPFFLKVLHSLQKYNRDWIIPYLTIMFSTGPLFVSVMWKQYTRWGTPEGGEIRVLLPEDYKMHENSFFSIARGSSWHLDDADFIKWLGQHILACFVVGFLVAGIVLYLEFLVINYFSSQNKQRAINTEWNRLGQWLGLKERADSAYKPISSTIVAQSDPACPSRIRRLRKDSNLPTKVIIPDLEKQDPKFTDLSS